MASAHTSDRGYSSETATRIRRMVRVLVNIRQDGAGDFREVLSCLREQAEASRLAGFYQVSRLCRTMEDCLAVECYLADVRGANLLAPAETAGALLNACRAIQTHLAAIPRGPR